MLALPPKIKSAPITTIRTLCVTLGVTEDELRSIAALPAQERFSASETAAVKKDGSIRLVYKPSKKVRMIQARINSRIFNAKGVIEWPDYLYGSIPKTKGDKARDYIAAAQVHCRAKSLLTMDIKNFFDNIHEVYVERMFFRLFRYGRDVSKMLANLCCYDGRLVQGALTSSYIANLVLHDVEAGLVSKLRRKNLRYTRLVDDINISSDVSNYDFCYAIDLVRSVLAGKELPVNEAKTKIQYTSTSPMIMHGLRIGFGEPRLQVNDIKRIKSAVHELVQLRQKGRSGMEYRQTYNKAMGRVNKLKRVKHTSYSRLFREVKKSSPLPNDNDLFSVSKLVLKVEKDFIEKRVGYLQKKRFYIAQQKLNLLDQDERFRDVSKVLRKKLRDFRPKNDDF